VILWVTPIHQQCVEDKIDFIKSYEPFKNIFYVYLTMAKHIDENEELTKLLEGY